MTAHTRPYTTYASCLLTSTTIRRTWRGGRRDELGNRPSPVPLPMGEGTLLHAPSAIQGSLLPPHPLADAVTLRGKLAEASLLGEGQDEGRNRRSFRRAALSHARCKLHTLIGTSTFNGTEACRDEPCLPSRDHHHHDPCLPFAGCFAATFVSASLAGEPLLKCRPNCSHCGQELKRRDLIPVFSLSLSLGACRNCHAPIPLVYPATEAAFLAAALWASQIGQSELILPGMLLG